MPLDAFCLALAAAFVHAVWNLLTARAEQSQTATGVSLAVAAVVFAPVAALTWAVDAAVVPYAIASVGLELGYFGLLATAYQRGPLSVVYPVARGAAPVLVAAVSAVFLGVSLSAAQVLGVLVVAGGIVLVRGFDRPTRGVDLALALATACAIAAYTLVDKQALEHADPLPYLELVTAPTAVIYLVVVVRLAGASAYAANMPTPASAASAPNARRTVLAPAMRTTTRR
jgi:drug/metabolite transporter (DMT)-like permease